MRNHCVRTSSILSILLLWAFVAGCHGNDPIRIGVVLPLSGEYQAYGEASRRGLLYDVKDFPGVTGKIQFDDKRQVSKIPRIYSVAEDLSLQDHRQWLRDREEEERVLRARLAELHAIYRSE